MPDVSWAKELGIDLATLEMERPDDYQQRQLAQLQTKRAEAFAEYTKLKKIAQTDNPFDVFGIILAGVIAWERYCGLTRTVCDLTGADIPEGIITVEQQRSQNIEDAVLHNTCIRCGFIRNTRQPKFVGGLCSSCLALQEKVLRRGRLACQPWQGRFAPDDVTPVNASGQPILPGRRVCNNSDCVNPKHITKGRNQNG